MSEAIQFTVPATSANLGPGFGVIGLALDLSFVIRAEESGKEGHVIERAGDSESLVLDLRHDGVLRGMQAAASTWKIKLPANLFVQFEHDMLPRGYGLGSNSADFAAGIGIAVRYAKTCPSPDECLELLVDLGGDPAHGAAALCGGLTTAVSLHTTSSPGNYRLLTHPIHDSWRFVIVAPEHQIGTADIHRVVPPTLPHIITQRTAGRMTALLRAFAEADIDLLGLSLKDEVHVPYRKGLTPGMEQAMDAAQAAGAAGVTISGHGPALIAATTDEARINAIGSAMTDAFQDAGSGSMKVISKVRREGVLPN